ncbi:hypothetical protein LEP1GSC083_3902 [Leptospira interrogans serovar Pyrogenes str. L0374]|nr:hypothetical protein LEP1GSC083_3902 [Leptospira interrogans serovar Pyrogenes str. L0374]
MIVLPMLGVSCGSVGILFLINTILNYRKEIREIISIQKEIVSGNFLMEIPEKKGIPKYLKFVLVLEFL